LKNAGFRNAGLDKRWYDAYLKKLYIKFSIDIIHSKKLLDSKNCIFVEPYYLTTDIISNYVRINNEKGDVFYDYFTKNEKSEVFFTKIDELSMEKRILLWDKTGKPVIFYKYYKCNIENISDRKKKKLEDKIIVFDNIPNLPEILGFTGDVCIEDYVTYSIKKNGYDFTFKEVGELLETPDIMSINLEFTITHRGKKEDKHFTYRASEDDFKIIYDSSIDYAACANNHSMDYGEISLLDTISYLDKYNISHSGSGKNKEEAFKPVLINTGLNKLAYFSICDANDEVNGYPTMEKFKAEENKPGIAFYDKDLLKKLFKKYKSDGYTVIVQYHTGYEYVFEPEYFLKKRNRKLIKMGADAVVCHHPHVINGVEIYKNKIIAYSLGDFLFDIQKDFADEGIMLYLFIKDNEIKSWAFYPTVCHYDEIKSWAFYPTVCHYGAVTIDEDRIIDVEKRFINLCEKLIPSK
jgi:poly-gamma-glutamate synthesis protein (capsule biosynthesis protein)